MDSEEAQSLGGAVRALRKARGLRQIDLAVSGRISRSLIGALERGEIQAPSLEAMEIIAERLGVSVGELFAYRERSGIRQGLTMARRHFRHHHFHLAVSTCEVLLPQARKLHDTGLLAQIDQLLAESHLLLGNHGRSARWATLALLRHMRSEPSAAHAVLVLAESLQALHHPRLVIALYHLWLSRVDGPPNYEEVRVRLHLGDAYRVSWRYRQASHTYRRVIALAHQLGLAKDESLALVGLAQCLHGRGEVDEALHVIGQAKILARERSYAQIELAARATEVRVLIGTMAVSQARALLQAECAPTPDTLSERLDTAGLCESLAELEWWQHRWSACAAAADHGLNLIDAYHEPQVVALRSRLLWFKSLAHHALNDPRADVYHAWAVDLCRLNRANMRDLPPWPPQVGPINS